MTPKKLTENATAHCIVYYATPIRFPTFLTYLNMFVIILTPLNLNSCEVKRINEL